jgi:hypothetical protein
MRPPSRLREGGDPVHGDLDALERLEVADPDVVGAVVAEHRAGEDHDAGLLQEPFAELRGGQARRRDVRVDVERPARVPVGEAGVGQRGHQPGPAFGVFVEHRLQRVLRAGERGERRVLADRAGVDRQRVARLGHLLHEVEGRGEVAHAPAGHGVGLGEAVQRDRPLLHPRQRGDGEVLVRGVEHLGVDLVGHDQDVVAQRDLGDLADHRGRRDRAGGVVGRDQHEGLRARRDPLLDLGRVEREVVAS